MSTDQAATTASIGDLPAGVEFREFVWNGDGSGQVTESGTVNAGPNGTITVAVPAGSLVALTTRPQEYQQ
jgi:hypothetical protein